MKRIVLTTLGSLGDVHPYIAIAIGLRARGHDVVVATSACYRRKIESLGLGFHSVRPNSAWTWDPVVMRRVMGPRFGTILAVTEQLLPHLRASYDDTLAAVAGADLIVSHPICYATRLVAEKTGMPWASTMISPMGFFSAYDMPIVPPIKELSRVMRWLPPRVLRPVLWAFKRSSRFLAAPIYRLRAELGLPATTDVNPLSEVNSPQGVLALWSEVLAPRQPDWPQQTVVTGFPFFDGTERPQLSGELSRFLDDGPPPVVFTLGDSAAAVAERFFEHSVEAARMLGRRAVLVVSPGRGNAPPAASLSDPMMVVDYAPFSAMFPRAAAIVHAGGIGSTGLAMRAGRPALVVPHAHDQLDNATRTTRLRIARQLPARRYTARRAAAALDDLLENPAYAARAADVSASVSREDGVAAACNALEGLL